MSQTEVQLIKADAKQVILQLLMQYDIVGISSSKLSGALPAISGAVLTNLPASGNLIIN